MVVTGRGDGVFGAVLDDAFNDFLLSRRYPAPLPLQLPLLLLLPAEPPRTTTEL